MKHLNLVFIAKQTELLIASSSKIHLQLMNFVTCVGREMFFFFQKMI